MPTITDINIGVQTGTTNTYYATWKFNETTASSGGSGGSGGGGSSGGAITVGSLVRINPGATYYNGVRIPTWVMNDQWYVYQLRGDRAVINRNRSGSHSIMSPINVRNLTKV